jgi:hypothetical protein
MNSRLSHASRIDSAGEHASCLLPVAQRIDMQTYLTTGVLYAYDVPSTYDYARKIYVGPPSTCMQSATPMAGY